MPKRISAGGTTAAKFLAGGSAVAKTAALHEKRKVIKSYRWTHRIGSSVQRRPSRFWELFWGMIALQPTISWKVEAVSVPIPHIFNVSAKATDIQYDFLNVLNSILKHAPTQLVSEVVGVVIVWV